MLKSKIYLIFILLRLAAYSRAFSYPRLSLLNVIFRHGDRLPQHGIAGDLTNVGRQRAYHLGVVLRELYGDFLGDNYEPASLNARSTEYTRAIASLQLLLAALYAPSRHQSWHESLAWQPIPFSYEPVSTDMLLFPSETTCFQRELRNVNSTPEAEKLLEPYRDFMKSLSHSTGLEVIGSYDMFTLYHRLLSFKAMNQTLPQWAEGIFPGGLLLNGTYLYYDLLKFNDWMRKVNGGTLLRKIVNDVLEKISGESASKRKIFLYGTHELMIVSLLQSLHIWKGEIPEYSNAIIVELREDLSTNFIRILYYYGESLVFKEMRIPGCPSLCPLNKFIELIADELPDDDEIICEEE